MTAVAHRTHETPADSPFAGDGLRRLVSRRYELRLVERGLWSRPVSCRQDEGDEEGDGTPHTGELPELTSDVHQELREWLARVVLVDGNKRFPATELGRDFANEWRRAGGEAPLSPLAPARPHLVLVRPPPASPVEEAAAPPLRRDPPPPAIGGAVASPAIDLEREAAMALTELQQGVVDTFGLSARDAAAKLGCSTASLYAMRSRMKKGGLLGSPKAKRAARAAEGGGRPADAAPADDALIAPLRAALEEHDAKRARIVAAITALGGEA